MASALPGAGSAAREAGAPPARVPLATLVLYGPPILGLSALLFFVQFFFLKFATDVLLLAPGLVATLFALGRLWDAVSDPLVGTWSDRTRTRLGRRRPWMLGGLVALGASFAMIWVPPRALPAGSLAAWVALALFAFYTAFTAYGIPHFALGAELRDDHHDRSRVYGTRAAAFTLGMLPAFAAMQLVNNAEDPRGAAAAVAWWGAVAGSLVLLAPLRVPERREFQGRGPGSSLRALLDVVRNGHGRRILAVQFTDSLGVGVLGILAPYFAQYVLRRPDLIAALPAVFVVCALAAVPLWVGASRRIGKRAAWIVSLLGVSLSFGSTIAVGENDVAWAVGLLVTAGLFAGCGNAIGPSMLADVIDADELATGSRREGIYAAAWGFSFKGGSALTIFLTGIALELSGFQPNVEQGPAAAWTLRGIFAGAPLSMSLLGALLLRGYTLDAAEHAGIRAELERRRSGPPGA
jgi:GPH family glycoside/pentoside/hexuronide:cation symporter